VIRLLRWIRRNLALVAELAAYGFWFLVDLVAAAVVGPAAALVPAVAVPLVVLLRRRPGARLIPTAATAIGLSVAISLFTTVQALVFPGSPLASMAFTEQLALAVVVVVVLHRCPLRPALLLTAAAALAIVGSPLMRTTDPDTSTFEVLSALGWGGAVTIGLVLREVETRRRAAVEEVRTGERMELARELHDVVAHHVTGIVVAAQAAAVVARTSPDDVDRALAAIETAGADALTAMRRMVGVLRGQDAEGTRSPGTDLAEVHTLVRRFDPDARLVRLTGDPGLEHAVLPPGVAATGYRVVQEALTNVRRHAPHVTAVEIDVRIREEALLVSVRNDGVPPAPVSGRGGGFGLVGMGERVAALDGWLTAGPVGPGLWAVSARLPLRGAR
jgi:signal transduction histidine kinase